jgi:hypothetical protein
VSVEEVIEVVVVEVGERFERVEWGEPLATLFLARDREKKAKASRTGPCDGRGGLGYLVEGGGTPAAPAGCIS